MLAGLAVFFGRSLCAGQMPLIERIARVDAPLLAAPLCRYTRRLTLVWTVWFGLAALICASAAWLPAWTGAAVWLGSVLLFVGEHALRPWLFPGQRFAGLRQQVRDTVGVWRRRPVP